MQRLIICVAKPMENFLHGIEGLLRVGVFLLAVGSVTTYLYHTAYRQLWLCFIVILSCGTIGGALLSAVELALVKSICPENMSKAFSVGQIEGWNARRKKGDKILYCVMGASILVGRIMVGGYSQTFTGDPWWVTIEKAPFVTMVPFGFYQGIQERIYDSILKAGKKS